MKFSAIILAVFLVINFSPAKAMAESLLLSHSIEVRLDPASHIVEGRDTLNFAERVEGFEFWLYEGFHPKGEGSLSRVESEEEDEGGARQWRIDLNRPSAQVVLTWKGEAFQDVSGTVFGRENVGAEISATVGEEGVFLSGGEGWYPYVEGGLYSHRVTTTLPEGWKSLTQGEKISEITEAGWTTTVWNAPRISDGLNLVANRWRIDSRLHGETLIETYFFPEDSSLVDTYLDETAGYLDLYESFLSPYPYAKFAIVENFFPTGYGMPGWTLLGQQVIRLPFIVKTSLGHEIAHNWWGNSVFVGEGGNWCEGITVYSADYLYKELKHRDEARQYRKTTLKDYTVFTADENEDFPLNEFVSRHNAATRSVGYGKSMFVFHMLEEKVGREVFRASLRRVIDEHQWSEASWGDFFRAAEIEAGLAPGSFDAMQNQWVNEAGAPTLFLEDVEAKIATVAFTIRQEGGVWDLDVPVNIHHDADECVRCDIRTVQLDVAEKRFELPKQAGSGRVEIDPEYHVFRRLHEDEMEATISLILSDESPLFILESGLDSELEEAFRGFASSWVEGDAHILSADDPSQRDAARTVIWLGKTPPPFRETPEELKVTPFFTIFHGQRLEPSTGSVIYSQKRGEGRGFMALLVSEAGQVGALGRKVPHYGKYSYLAFENGKNCVKGNWATGESPLSVNW
jgi:aminopeptidase N